MQNIKSDTLNKNIPVVIFTSSNEEKDIISGYKYGFKQLVFKTTITTKLKSQQYGCRN